jgi:hypothetical protein
VVGIFGPEATDAGREVGGDATAYRIAAAAQEPGKSTEERNERVTRFLRPLS